MTDNSAGVQIPAKKSQPDRPEKEAAVIVEGNPSSAPRASPSDSADGATVKPPAQEENANPPNLADFKKQAAQSAGQLGWLYEFARAMPRTMPRTWYGNRAMPRTMPRTWYGNINIINIREGGVDINAPTQAGGDIVGSDAIKRAATSFSYMADSGVSGQLNPSEIAMTVDVYVETAGYQRALKILREKHILILSGDADMGKRSAAIRLLESFHQETIFEIAPTLEDLTAFRCQPRQGYLWNTPAAEKIASLSRFALDQISREQKEQESHLVITLTKGLRITSEAAREYLLEWNECPDGAAVVDKHLAWHLKNESEDVQAEAADIRGREEIEVLANDKARRPSQSGRLAELLVQAARKELSVEELLTSFANLNRQDAQIWFERHPQLNQQLQMVALAVLHGSSFQKIISASKDLRAYLAPGETPGADAKATQTAEVELSISIRQWLSEFEAKVVIREISAEYGRSTIEAVVFNKARFQSAVLAYVWQELQHWRTPLFNWLVEMGESDNLEYRIAAAMALSEISQYYAFEDVLREAVSPWAKADEPDQRRLAAFILMLQGLEKDLSAQVLGLLRHWAKTPGNWRLQWTAATAYGTELGLAYPELAVRDLYEVFLSSNLVVHVSVLITLRYLFESGRQHPQLFTVVLRALESWTRDERLMIQNVLYIFLVLLESHVSVDNEFWPTILWLAALDQTYERQFRALFSAALKDIEICELLLDHLQRWLEEADKNHGMFKLIGRVLYALFKSPDAGLKVARRIIADRLKRWEASGQSRSAGKLLAILKESFSI
jgi:hypothetical protein